MSCMVDWQLRRALKDQEIIIDPFDDNLINPNSIDFRLGEVVSFLKTDNFYNYVNPLNKDSFTYEEFNIKDSHFLLKPKQFCIASMLENIKLPAHIKADVRGKSSLGRLGLMQSSVAGVVDSGWSGILTIELYNYSDQEIMLEYGMKIGQIMFERVETAQFPYGVKGRYQNQVPGCGSFGV